MNLKTSGLLSSTVITATLYNDDSEKCSWVHQSAFLSIGPHVISIESDLAELREIVRGLEATGENGFEGLTAAVLTEIAKTRFDLAKSGSQRGKDGQSVLNAGAMSFERKLYEERVPKNEVYSKLAEIVADDAGNVDLWILGSTGTIATQDRDTIAKMGEKFAIATLILDWSTVGRPALVTLLALAPAISDPFLISKNRRQRTADYRKTPRGTPAFSV